VLPGTVQAIWDTVARGDSMKAVENSSGIGTYTVYQSLDNLFDNSADAQYSSRGNSSSGSNIYSGLNTGFYVTVGPCPSVLVAFIFTTSGNGAASDPITITIEGSNSTNLSVHEGWFSIYNGSSGLSNTLGRLTDGESEATNNIQTYKSYRFLVTSKRGLKSDVVSYNGVKLYGQYILGTTPSQSKFLYFTLSPQ
jgi:hypothetical protein